MKMKNLHGKFEAAFKNRVGQTFSRPQIKEILFDMYSDFKDGSVLPNDHGRGNVNPCRCSGTDSQIFDTINGNGRPVYRVLDFKPLT